MTPPEQLPFELPFRTAQGRGDFFVSPANAAALACIDSWPNWPQGKYLCIGPKGSGKSHLAQIWQDTAGAFAADMTTLPQDGAAVVVEDLDQYAGNPDAEAYLFHLFNHLTHTGGTVLFTAKTAPQQAGFQLPDLVSRLQTVPAIAIDHPDDALLGAVLTKHFADRQLTPGPQVMDYLLRHMERSFAGAATVVARLDAKALARKRPITRGMAAEVVAEISG